MDNVEYIQQEYEWSELPWNKFEKVLYKLQKRIYRASLRGNVANVRRLQKLLIKSRSAKLISVRRISQDNQGHKTAGVDGVKNLTPKQRFELVDKISLNHKVSPVRRIWIPKPGKEEKRPLGIPTMYDRALQCLCKMALEPEWEAKFEPNSYGFRPVRSCHDAIEAIFSAIKTVPKYVLDADISQCFDKINHQKLLEKLNTFPSLRRINSEMSYDGINSKFKSRDWIFSTTKDGKIEHKILFHSDTDIIRHIKVKGNASPYDGNLVYWSTRMGKNPLLPKRKAKLLKSQKGKCIWCKLTFRHGDLMEVDHIIPKSNGGNNYYKNLQLLHRHCHDEKTANDCSKSQKLIT